MRYIIGFVFLLLCFSGYGQTVRTVGLVYVASAPTHTPSSQGAWLAVDTTSGSWYEWERTTGVWRDAGYRVQFTYTSGAPNYTPSKARGRVAVNSGDSLYVYQNATWNLLSGGGGGADNWGTDVVNRDGTLSGDGTVGSPLKVDTSVIATIYDINSLSSTDTSGYNLAFTRSLDTLYLRDGNGTLSVVLPAGSVDTDDQGLTIGVSGPTYSIDIDGGSDVTISAGGIITLSESTANVLTFTANETDASVTNEIQNVDTLVLSGTTLGISLSSDGVAQKTVDLSSLQDGTGTDDQKVDTFAIVSNVLRLSVESDAEAFKSVDLSPYLDNTDTQDLSIDSLGDWYTVSLVAGGSVNIKKDTDTQLTEEQVEDFVGGMVTGNTETLIDVTYQDGDGTLDFVVNDDLSLYDNTTSGFITSETDDQKIDTFTIVSNTLRLSVEGDAEPFKSVDLSTYLDNTDAQTLSFSNPNLSISGGNSVNISGIDTDTDDQGLTIGGSGPTYTVDIDGGADVTIAAGGINALSEGTPNVLTITATEVDGSTTNEIQDLSLTVNTLALSSDASTVDLSGYLDNTDDQGLTVTGSGPDYVINQEDGTDITVSAAGIATLSEPSANELRITATEVDGSTTNELQTIDTFTIVSNVLRASLLNDGVPFEDVDLSPYLDNTDAQGFTVTDDGTTFDFDLSGTASDFALVEGTGITLSRTGNDVTIESTGGADDQNLTITGSGPDYVVDIESGNDVTISAAGITTLSEGTANVLTITSTEVDGSITNEIQSISVTGTTTATIDLSDDATDASITGAGIAAVSVVGNAITVTATEAQTFSGSDDGTTFTLDLSGAATDISFKEGSNVTITRSGTELTFASSGSADNWGTDVVNRDGTLSGNGTVASPLKVDTTVIATKDHVYKGKVSQESSETIKTSNFTAVKTVIHPVDCSAGAITVTPPSSPAIGDRFAIVDSEAQAATNNITIDFTTGSYKLYTAIQNYIINVDGGYVEFIYMGTTTGWIATKG